MIPFREVIARARAAPPSVELALQNVAVARAQLTAAEAQYLPRLSLEGRYGVDYRSQPYTPEERVDGTVATTSGTASAEWLVTDFGSRRSGIEAAKHNEAAAKQGGEAARNDAARGASELYVQVVADKAWLANAHENIERREAQFKLVQKLVDAGLRPTVDVMRARVDVIAAERAVQVAEAQLSIDRAALAAALGLDPAGQIDVADQDLADLTVPVSAEAASELAEERRAELGQAQEALAVSESKLTQAGRARLPTLSLVGTGQVANVDLLRGQGIAGNTYQAGGGVVARWSALDVVTWRNVRVARESLRGQEVQRKVVSLRVRSEAVQAFFALDKAHASLAQATQVLESAKQALGAQSDRYRAGIASLLELLDAQNIEQQARGSVIVAKREVDLASVRLLAACGVLGQSD